MINPDRLDGFYDELKKLHKIVPDLRFGQIIEKFSAWYYWKCKENKTDIYYLEDDVFLEKFKEFLKGDK